MKRRVATLVLFAAATPLAAQWLTLETPGIPRTADGAPDLSAPAPRAADGNPDLTGLWSPAERTGDVYDPAKSQEWAQALMAERERSYFDAEPRFSCLPSGPGLLTLGDTSLSLRRIVQNPSIVAFLNEDLTYRQVFMDGRDLEADPLPIWMGYSVGRWEGDTLVVESNGYNDKTWLHRDGLSHTEALRITERYRRPDYGHLELEVVYDDPGTFDGPVHANISMRIVADDEMLETVCDEASEGMKHWGGEVTEAQEENVEVAPEILSRYVGIYTGSWLSRPTTIDVTLEDGGLFLERTPPYQTAGTNIESEKSELIPVSDTAFECACGIGFIFSAEDGEMAAELSEIHVSGAWTFTRVP